MVAGFPMSYVCMRLSSEDGRSCQTVGKIPVNIIQATMLDLEDIIIGVSIGFFYCA